MENWNRWLKHLFAMVADTDGQVFRAGLHAFTSALSEGGWGGSPLDRPSCAGGLGERGWEERASSCLPHLVGGPGARAAGPMPQWPAAVALTCCAGISRVGGADSAFICSEHRDLRRPPWPSGDPTLGTGRGLKLLPPTQTSTVGKMRHLG